MPNISWNQGEWGGRYPWDDGGEEWSALWGGSAAQWQTCIWPRAGAFLPVGSLVEIAPGYGRWTEYLLPRCKSYVGVDLAERCVDACRERFAGTGAEFAVGDGRSLPMVPDGSADLVFSFDSLVHAEADVIAAYLGEFTRILSDDGVAFIHHSNAGAYSSTASLRDFTARLARRLPRLPKGTLARLGLTDWHHFRGRSVTGEGFAQMAADAGLSCTGQEVFPWTTPLLTDCISVVTRPGSRWDRPGGRVVNRDFTAAARSSAKAARVFPQRSEPVAL